MRGKRVNPAPWISVDERLPEDEKDVLVLINKVCVVGCVAKTPHGTAWYLRDQKAYINRWNVTHWMPLPALPNGGGLDAQN